MQVTDQSLHLGGLKDPSMRIPQVHRQLQFSYQVTCYMWTSLNGLKYSRDKEGAEAETETSVDQLCTSDWRYKRLITKLSSKNYMSSNFFLTKKCQAGIYCSMMRVIWRWETLGWASFLSLWEQMKRLCMRWLARQDPVSKFSNLECLSTEYDQSTIKWFLYPGFNGRKVVQLRFTLNRNTTSSEMFLISKLLLK